MGDRKGRIKKTNRKYSFKNYSIKAGSYEQELRKLKIGLQSHVLQQTSGSGSLDGFGASCGYEVIQILKHRN